METVEHLGKSDDKINENISTDWKHLGRVKSLVETLQQSENTDRLCSLNIIRTLHQSEKTMTDCDYLLGTLYQSGNTLSDWEPLVGTSLLNDNSSAE